MPAVNKAIDDFRSKNPNFKLPASSFMLAGLEARVQDALTIKKGSFCCPFSFFSNLSDFLSAPIPAASLRPEKISYVPIPLPPNKISKLRFSLHTFYASEIDQLSVSGSSSSIFPSSSVSSRTLSNRKSLGSSSSFPSMIFCNP